MLLGETFRMVYLKCVSCNGKLMKIAFYYKNTKTRFIGFNFLYRLQNPLFFGKPFGDPCEKMGVGVGVHGKACWPIAYPIQFIMLNMHYVL